jgi:iron(III) transport system ATP-binding protein
VEIAEIGAEAFVIDGEVGTPFVPGAAVGVSITADGAALVPADTVA